VIGIEIFDWGETKQRSSLKGGRREQTVLVGNRQRGDGGAVV
jgi:hypothetical protein